MGEYERINPLHCRLWQMHDRHGEYVTEQACAPLIESFRLHGQKTPALGRRLCNDPQGYQIELIYGARRLFAARHLGCDLLVAIRDLDDRQALIEMDIENRVRADISPYERGCSYMHWLREGYFSNQAEMAKAIGISEARVSRLLRFCDLPTIVVDAFPSPHEIKEQWAVGLSRRLTDTRYRESMLKKARQLHSIKGLNSRHVFERLMNAGEVPSVAPASRDQIVRGDNGEAIVRVSVRSATVHLIMNRQTVTDSKLKSVVNSIRAAISLEDS
jgi:ParB family transcriptional regulator, chromosome partitioning protein